MENSLSYWLMLWHFEGIGPRTYQDILKKCPDPKVLFDEPHCVYEFQRIKQKEKLINFLKNPPWHLVALDLQWLEQSKNRHIIKWGDSAYPSNLANIHAPSPLLFVEGEPTVLSTTSLAIVGARQCTSIGKENAYYFASLLAAQGLTITSGLARGIDSAAHWGAVSKGKTIAVLGHGLSRIYPEQNKGLAEKILETGGALVSEFPLSAQPKAEHFPRRNRIIAGLSYGVLVIEAKIKSGSLITVRYALEEGREVFALPGSIQNPLSEGCHHLIRQGATLVERPEQILEELNDRSFLYEKSCSAPIKEEETYLEKVEERMIVDACGYETTALDTIILRTGLTLRVVSSILLELELNGILKSVPGGYVRVTEGKRNERNSSRCSNVPI